MPGRVLRAACIAVVVLAVGAGSALASEGEALHPMKIDATGLMPTPFSIDGRRFQGTSVETIELAAGQLPARPGSGLVMRCALMVTGAGTWDLRDRVRQLPGGSRQRHAAADRLRGHGRPVAAVDADLLRRPEPRAVRREPAAS